MNMPLVLLNRRRRGFTAFSPSTIFSTTAIGVWLDPSDVANLAWRRNLLTYSEQFGPTSAFSTQTNVTTTDNAAVAPNGTLTAATMVNTTTNGQHRVYQNQVWPSGVATFSVYAKADTASFVQLVFTSGGFGLFATFDLSNGTVSATGASSIPSITPVGNGWYRCVLTSATSGLIGSMSLAVYEANATAILSAYAGTVKGILIWGAQLELGTSATDYQRISDVNTEVLERFPTATMFSDRAGTTAVTTPGTVVGLRLDKSKGLVLGAELVTNGTFDSGTTGWAAHNTATLSNVGGRLRVAASASFDGAYGSFPAVIGKRYRVEYSVYKGTASTFRFEVSFGAGAPYNYDSGALSADRVNFVFSFVATHTTTFIGARCDNAGAYIELDNISVRELAGNHAVAPTDAARPIYGVEPKGGRRNLLLATDTLATQSLAVAAVAHTLAFTGTGTVTLSGASTAGPLVGTGAGNRVSLTFTPTAASLTLTVSGSVTLGQLELGSSATAYQKVVTAYDVTESGVATCHYVQYDGSDDSMSTAAIDFTATDKMSVFAGVRKLSGAGFQALIELGTGIVENGFSIFAPSSLGPDYDFRLAANARAVAGTYTPPVSNIVQVVHDLSGATASDETKARINGASVSFTGSGVASGSFINAPLYIGRRNNATLPFNGRDYGIIIVGKTASAGEISDTETWLAAKTAQVTL